MIVDVYDTPPPFFFVTSISLAMSKWDRQFISRNLVISIEYYHGKLDNDAIIQHSAVCARGNDSKVNIIE